MVSRKKFNKEVKAFEEYYQRSLEQCLSTPRVREAFFQNKTINRYLARPARDVTFINKHPWLKGANAQENADKNDYYELCIYRKLPDVIPYREKRINSYFFYDRTTPYKASAIFSLKFTQLNARSHSIYVDHRTLDMAGVVRDLMRVSCKAKKTKYHAIFRLYSVTHEAHTTSLLIIMNSNPCLALIALSLDSQDDNVFFNDLKNRFLSLQQHKISFVEMNYHLQLANDDLNCVLYSLNFIEALVTYLTDHGRAQNMLRMATSVALGYLHENALRDFLHHDLKQFLPFYYETATGQAKSLEELSEYHARERWDLGSESLSLHL